MFSGQLVLETGRSGITFDIHSNNVDIQAHNFHIKAPEASLSSSSVNREGESHKIDGFVKLDHLTIGSLGLLKMPLEINLSAEGTPDNLTLNELTITEKGSEVTFLEVEGTLKPREVSAQLDLTVQVPQLSRLWDFTPLLAVHATDKVSVEGKVNLAGEFLLEKGKWVSSPLAIDMRGVSLSRAGFSIEGGAAQLVFNTVKPVVTKGPQRLSAKKINTNGVELRDVSLDGLFNEEGLLQLKDFKASTLNGHLKAHRFERLVDVSYPAFQFEVDFTDIELAEILRLTNLASLSGQAKLAGNASMRYDWKEGLDVVQAELHSVSDTGLIQYKPEVGGVEEAALKTQEVSMAFQVLNNLHFSLFNVRISHAPDNPSEMQGIVKILGSNPNVLNGYPFEFNIVTAGKLKDLVVNTLQHMKPPTDLKQLDQAIKATNDSKMVVDDNGPKEAKAVKKAKAVEATKVVKVFKKRKSKFKKRNRNRKVKYV